MRKLIWLAVFPVLTLAFWAPAFGGDIYVATNGSDETGDGSEGNPYATIQKGIDEASTSDTVIVKDGTYSGTGNKDLDFGGKAITVESQYGAASTIIDCEDDGRCRPSRNDRQF